MSSICHRLNARPYRWRSLRPFGVALVGGPWHLSRPFVRLGARDNAAATVRAMGDPGWTLQCQKDFFFTQQIMAEAYGVVLAAIDDTTANNVKILNFNRNLIVAEMEKDFGQRAQSLFYKWSGNNLRGFYLYGLSKEEMVYNMIYAIDKLRSENDTRRTAREI